MPVAAFITSEKDVSSLIPWGVRFAAADHRDLVLILPRSEIKKSDGRSGRVWPRIWFLAFVVISVILAAIMTLRNGIDPRAYFR